MLAAQGEKRAGALPPSSDMADNRANSADVRSFRSEDAIKNELPRCGGGAPSQRFRNPEAQVTLHLTFRRISWFKAIRDCAAPQLDFPLATKL